MSATVAGKTLIVPDLEVVQDVYEPAALCFESIETLSVAEPVWLSASVAECHCG